MRFGDQLRSSSDVPDDPKRTAPPDDEYDIAARRRQLERDEANDEEWLADER
jgi:hypothetical protein